MYAPRLAAAVNWLVPRPTREPDVHINSSYMLRWYLIPRNRWFNVYYHAFLGSDPEDFHDHPWWSVSLCLSGGLLEFRPDRPSRAVWRGDLVFRRAKDLHRLERVSLLDPCTLFITGPRLRVWGFMCAGGWRPWHTYNSLRKDGTKLGCGED